MSKNHVVEQLLAYLNGNLDDAASHDVREHLASCSGCRREYEDLNAMWTELGRLPDELPGAGVEKRFQGMLAAYGQDVRRQKDTAAGITLRDLLDRFRDSRPAFQLAFGAFMIVFGFLCGYSLNGVGRGSTELSALREEVHGLNSLLTVSLLHQESPSERLKGVSLSSRLEGPDPDIIAALVYTMKHDRNINVRLAALDALFREIGSPVVRREVIHALPDQTSPLMQVALVDILVQINDGESREVLREVMKKPGLLPDVRKRIEQGIQQIL